MGGGRLNINEWLDPGQAHADAALSATVMRDARAVERLLPLLDGVRTVPNGWVARCPAHEDRTPSLAVSEGEEGVLIHCFAGCGAAEVMGALGLGLGDLFDDRPQARKNQRHRRMRDARKTLDAVHGAAIRVTVAAAAILRREELSEADYRTVYEALRTIENAYENR